MAQSGYTPILIYASSTPGALPSAANLTSSASGAELAINYADGKLYFKNSSGVVTLLAGSSSGPAGGSNTQVQYNSSGVLAGSANMTFDGTSLTLGGNPTLSAGTANGVLYLNGSKVATSGSALTFDGTEFKVNAASGNVLVQPSNVANAKLYMRHGSIGNNNGFEVDVSSNTIFLQAGSEAMRLTSTGLGIGTSSVTNPLTIVSATATTKLSSSTTTNQAYHSVTNASGNMYFGINNSANSFFAAAAYAGIVWHDGAYPIVFGTSNTERMRLDSSGNLGLGVTPSAWSGFRAMQIGGTTSLWSTTSGNGSSFYTNNGYFNGSSRIYLTSGYATEYIQGQGQHIWYTAPSGTAGNAITFTQAMTLDSSGNLGIGTSSPGEKLHVNNSGDGVIRVTGGASGNAYFIARSAGELDLFNAANAAIRFSTNGTTKATLDSSGNLGLGVTPSGWWSSFKAFQFGTVGSVYSGSGVTGLGCNTFYDGTNSKYLTGDNASLYLQTASEHRWYNAPIGTAGNAITFTQAMTLNASGNLLVGYTADQGSGKLQVNGAGRIGNFDFNTDDITYVGGGNFQIGTVFGVPMLFKTSATERARITSGGDLLVGQTAADQSIQGIIFNSYGTGRFITNGGADNVCLYLNRIASDGAIQKFLRNSVEVGSVSVTTSATAYNTSSDYRLKDNPQPLTGSGAFIDALKPKTWNWKSGGKGVGFIAHEVQEVSPGSVVGTKDAVDADGKPVMQAMEYGSAEFIANIIAELQSLRQRVALLEGN